MYRRILVPTDGSAGARAAFDHAVALAGLADAAVHVVHAVDPTLVPAEVGVEEVVDALSEAGRDLVAELAAEAADRGHVVETAVVRGSPAEAVCRYADEHDVDLVVMGTHGRTGLSRWLLGSVTERVVRRSPVPVLTVNPSDD